MGKKTRKPSNWLDPATTAENEILPRYFKWAWASRAFSLAINVLMLAQLTYYCTDMLGMPATLVGTILLISKLFDGVTDVLVGFIIDNTHTRIGKARPYEIFIVFTWLFTVLLFSAPDWSMTGKAIYIFALYTLVNSICATFLNGADAVYLARSVRSEKNRISVMSFNAALLIIGMVAFYIGIPQLVKTVGATKPGWTTLSLLFAVPLGLIGILRFVFVKEVVSDEHAASVKSTEKKLSVKTSLKCIGQNKYLWLIAGVSFLMNVSFNTNSAVENYYFKYIMGDIGLASIAAAVNIVTPLFMIIFPALSKKIGTGGILKYAALAGVIGPVVRLIGGANMVPILIGTLFQNIGMIPPAFMIAIYIIECMDYGEWKTGIRVEGMVNSANSFAIKLAQGLASAAVGFIMGLGGYSGELAVQSASANFSIIAVYNILPLVCAGLTLLLSIPYSRLDKLLPDIRKAIENKKAQEE